MGEKITIYTVRRGFLFNTASYEIVMNVSINVITEKYELQQNMNKKGPFYYKYS